MKLLTLILSLVTLLALSPAFSFEKTKSFEVTPKNGIAPLEVSLNAELLHQHAEIFIWNFGNGETLTTTNPKINYTFKNPGTFLIQLKYLKNKQDKLDKGKDGGSATIVVVPNKLPIPVLNCNSDVLNKIECSSVGTRDEDGTIASYKYDWGDGSSNVLTSAETIEHTYAEGGLKTISLTVTDNKGGAATVEKEILVKSNTPPTANFVCTKTGIQKIRCESTSSDNENNISQFKWTLDDGAYYTSASFDHTFNRPEDVAISSHAIKLMVTDAYNESDSLSKNVEVNLEPITIAPRAYFKVFMDGTKVNLHAYITKTQFAIKRAFYSVYAQGTTTPFKTIELNEFYSKTVTKLDLEQYGIYRINLTVIDYRDQIIQLSRPFNLVEDTSTLEPFVEFRASQSAANKIYMQLNPSFDFDEFLAIRSFTINFGDGNIKEVVNDTFISHQYAEAGTYTISVTAKTNHNTQRTVTREITVTDEAVPMQNPDPTFVYQIYDYAQNVSFYNEKSGTPNGEIISYLWDFGDNTTGTGETQAHFYAPGTYIVSLTVTDTAGLKNTQTQKIVVSGTGSDLVANIDCSLVQPFVDLPQRCKVTALDRLNDISRVRVIWGDGTGVNLTTPFDQAQGTYFPTKKYAAAGAYPVRLVVNTNRGENKIHDINLSLTSRPPVANLQCYPNNLMVYCNALGSYDPKGLALSYSFDFGNGHIETNSSGVISYAYAEAGLYDVAVTVTDASGLKATAITKVQTVRPPNQLPIAILNCQSTRPNILGCNAGPSSDPDGFIVSAKYEYDDGAIFTYDQDYFFDHQFAAPGEHSVKLTVTDNDGGQSTLVQMFTVLENIAPSVAFECRSEKVFETICNSSSFDSDGFIVQKLWFVNGEATTFSGDYIQRMFNDASPVKIKLQVTDNLGLVSELEKEILIKENLAPVAAAICQSSGPLNLNCFSTSYDPENSGGLRHEWSLGSEVISIDSSFNKQMAIQGMANIVLKVTDFYGAVSSIEIPVIIQENIAPVADFECFSKAQQNLNCVSKSTDNDGSIASFVWILDDDIQYNGSQFEHTFTEGETHKVVLKVKDNVGAEATIEKSYNLINKPPQFELAYEQINNDLPRQIKFATKNAYDEDGEIVKYEWDLGDGTTLTGETLTHTYSEEGYYKVTLKVTDNAGIVNLKSTIIEVIEQFEVTVEPSEIHGQAPLLVHFNQNLTPDSNEIYEWYYRGEKISTEYSFEYIFDTVGKHYVTLKVINSEGRSSEKTVLVTTTRPPIYLEGDFRGDFFSGRDIVLPFNLLIQDNIPLENIQLSLENSPDGATVSDNRLTWSPTTEQSGLYEFKINVTDGLLNSFRIVRLNVVRPTIVLEKIVENNDINFTVNDSTSRLNGVEVILPQSDVNYTVSILEGKVGDESFVSIESDIPVKERVEINYKKKMDISSYSSILHRSEDASQFKISNYTISNEKRCFDDRVRKIKEANLDSYTEEWVYGKTHIYYKPLSLRNSLYYLRAKQMLKKELLPPALINQSQRVNIFLIDDYSGDSSVGAFVNRGDIENISIPLNNISKILLDPVFHRYLLAHEFYHLKQNEIFDCNKLNIMETSAKTNPLKVRQTNILESSADYFAYKNVEAIDAASLPSKIISKNGLYSPYNYFENFLSKNGVSLPSQEDLSDSPSYEAELLMDNNKYRPNIGFENGYYNGNVNSIKIDYNDLVEYMNNNFYRFESEPFQNYSAELFKGYARTIGKEYKHVLLSSTRDLTNKHPFRIVDKSNFADTDFMKHYKNLDLFTVWSSFEFYDSFTENAARSPNATGIKFPHGSSSISSSNIINFSMTIEPYSGAFRWFDFEDANNGLSSMGLPFFLIIKKSVKENSDIALEFNESQGSYINTAYIKEWEEGENIVYHIVPNLPFIGNGATGGPVIFDKPFNYGRFYISAANSFNTESTVDFTVKPACETFDRSTLSSTSSPFILFCEGGDCWNGDNATSFFACKEARPVWEPGNCIVPKFAHPICRKLQPDGNRTYIRDLRNGAGAQLVNDMALKDDHKFIVLCRNPDFNTKSSEVAGTIIKANAGYTFENYNTVNCENVGL